MDADRFDALTRSLTRGWHRRAVVAAVAGGFAPLFRGSEFDAHDALKSCKKKSGKQKKKCIKKARAHNATHTTQLLPPPGCTPSCGGKTCGPDGCGGLCGACGGASTCCQGECVSPCASGTARNPITCDCCTRGNTACFPTGLNPGCCTGFCGTTSGAFCQGQRAGQNCEFDGQCITDSCTNGTCQCPGGEEHCLGACYPRCLSDEGRNPESCVCCVRNGSNCDFFERPCCAGPTRCSGQGNTTCVGLPDGEPCTFNEQCASRDGCIDHKCGRVIGLP